MKPHYCNFMFEISSWTMLKLTLAFADSLSPLLQLQYWESTETYPTSNDGWFQGYAHTFSSSKHKVHYALLIYGFFGRNTSLEASRSSIISWFNCKAFSSSSQMYQPPSVYVPSSLIALDSWYLGSQIEWRNFRKKLDVGKSREFHRYHVLPLGMEVKKRKTSPFPN